MQDAAEIGRDLAEKLLKPILPAIAGYRQWIISPDSALAMLPFETLPVDGQPVIANHDVSYVQSLSMFALLKEREEQYRNLQGRKALFAMGGRSTTARKSLRIAVGGSTAFASLRPWM